jgi:hypothetical protein
MKGIILALTCLSAFSLAAVAGNEKVNPITQQQTSAIAPVKPRLLATSQTVLRI